MGTAGLLHPYSFAFSRMSYKWNHTVCSILGLTSLNKIRLGIIHIIACISRSLIFTAE